MIERYSRPQMQRLWSEEKKFQTWLEIELAVVDAWCSLGRVPVKAAKEIRNKAGFEANRITELEKETHHDVVAFIETVSEKIGPLSAYFHLGLTSSDLLDTANALLLKESASVLIDGLEELKDVFYLNASLYKDTIQMGRTHGIHAEPISLGLKFCGFYAEVVRSLERLERVRQEISVGKISGAVGTFAHLSPEVEEYVCRKLNLQPEPAATQVVSRDRYAEYVCQIAVVGASLERFALEVRHLQRTEVAEAAEPFGVGQKGSSAMPHKQNPILSERICGLARILRANAMVALENVALWHERDISHSSAERIILPDSTILLDYMIYLAIRIFSGLRVDPDRIKENLNLTGGLIYSQRVLSALVSKGLSRPDAYKLVQQNALSAAKEKSDFREKLKSDSNVKKYLKPVEIDALFNPDYFLRHQDYIYKRVFKKGKI
ncbi:MAG: adenylosuccinate lyase [Candidatus Ratteibacteria bacterium]